VCHIEAALGYRQAYISQQLSALREMGIVRMRRDGWNIYYRVIEPELFTAVDSIQKITGMPTRAVRRKSLTSKDCPCPKCNQKDKT
jgi:ArsR family transcriptional regulator